MLSCLKTYWSHKLLVISELHRQQSILLYSKTRSMPDRIVNLVQRHARRHRLWQGESCC
jgi:transposase, IS5 family